MALGQIPSIYDLERTFSYYGDPEKFYTELHNQIQKIPVLSPRTRRIIDTVMNKSCTFPHLDGRIQEIYDRTAQFLCTTREQKEHIKKLSTVEPGNGISQSLSALYKLGITYVSSKVLDVNPLWPLLFFGGLEIADRVGKEYEKRSAQARIDTSFSAIQEEIKKGRSAVQESINTFPDATLIEQKLSEKAAGISEKSKAAQFYREAIMELQKYNEYYLA